MPSKIFSVNKIYANSQSENDNENKYSTIEIKQKIEKKSKKKIENSQKINRCDFCLKYNDRKYNENKSRCNQYNRDLNLDQ